MTDCTNWQAEAAAVIGKMQGEFTGEDIRLECRDKGVTAHHPNAWGMFILQARKEGLIEPTGQWRPMRDPRSNSRQTQVYRRAQ